MIGPYLLVVMSRNISLSLVAEVNYRDANDGIIECPKERRGSAWMGWLGVH